MHELAHVSKHLSASNRLFIDDLDLRGKEMPTEDEIEREADELASNSLIPKKIWDKKPLSDTPKTTEVIALAEQLRIHPSIIAGRIRFERHNYRLLSNLISNQMVRKHFVKFTSDLN
jgi:HTH-type transcriptional regulator/antitoxin HigA